MKVVILCGGQGTRIRGVDDDLPKPMIPIGPRPIIWHIMKYYSCFGHKDFVLCLGYKGDVIRNYFVNYEHKTCDMRVNLGGQSEGVEYCGSHPESDWSVTLAETGLHAMTGARIKKIKEYIGDDETFLLTYGDGVGDIDIDALIHFHKSHGRVMTVSGVRPPGRFGEIRYDAQGLVSGFNEKPQVTAGRISGGYFVCNRKIFDYIDHGDDEVFEQNPMRKLVDDQQMVVFEHDGFWQPMDTHREFLLLNKLYSSKEAAWVKWND